MRRAVVLLVVLAAVLGCRATPTVDVRVMDEPVLCSAAEEILTDCWDTLDTAQEEAVRMTEFVVNEGRVLLVLFNPGTESVYLPADSVIGVTSLDEQDELQVWHDGEFVRAIPVLE